MDDPARTDPLAHEDSDHSPAGKPAKPRGRARWVALAIAVVLVMAFCVVSYVVDYSVLMSTFARVEQSPRTTIAHYDHFATDYQREPVSFVSGENTLQGYLYGVEMLDPSDGSTQASPKGVIVFSHGIGSWHQDYLTTLLALVDRGWIVFAYDATGSGESEGENVGSMSQSALDSAAALATVKADERLSGLPITLMGHSWGGYAVAAELAFDPDVAAVVSLSGYCDPFSIIWEQARDMIGPLAPLERPFIWLANRAIAGDHADLSAVDAINGCDVPILLVHGVEDTVIRVDGAALVAQRDRITNPNVEYLVLDYPGRSGHNSYFNSEQAQAYLDELRGEFAGLIEKHDVNGDGDLDDKALGEDEAAYEQDVDALFSSVDIARANDPNDELVDAIDAFMTRAITEP